MTNNKKDKFKADKPAQTYIPVRNYNYETNTDPAQLGKHSGMSQDDWKAMIADDMDKLYKSGDFEFLAYIFHDRDILREKDGTIIKDNQGKPMIKPLHVHVFAKYDESIEQADVMLAFHSSSYANCQQVNNNLASALYLIHMSTEARKDKKTKYSIDEVVSFGADYDEDLINDDFWNKKEIASDPTKVFADRTQAKSLLSKIGLRVKNGEIRKSEAIKLYEEQAGYFWLREFGHTFSTDQNFFIEERVRALTTKEIQRNLSTLYIMGAGGVGKSFLATALGVRIANGRGVINGSVTGKGKTPDMLDGVTDEHVLILNEFSANALTVDESTDCFDPHTYAKFPSRNENKHFIGEQIILTNSLSPLRYAKDVLIYDKGGSDYQDSANKKDIDYNNPAAVDKYWQVRRRLKNIAILVRDEVNPDIVHCCVFNLRKGIAPDGAVNANDGDHVFVGSIQFECKANAEPVITDDALNDLIRLLEVEVSSTDVQTLGEFLDNHGMTETSVDPLIQDFISDVVNQLVWDVVPMRFLYDIFGIYRSRHYPSADKLSIRELAYALDSNLTDWDWKDSPFQVRNRMDNREPLVVDYFGYRGLNGGKSSEWYTGDYTDRVTGINHNFVRRNQYRNVLVRK